MAHNPFVNLPLRFPVAYFDKVRSYCLTGARGDGEGRSPKDAPFPRYVDFWFLALCVGAANAVRVPDPPAGGWQDSITGSEAFASDPWRVDAVEMVAIAAKDDETVVARPSEVMDIANRYAADGIPQILDWLKAGDSDPVDSLMDHLRERLADISPDTSATTVA